MEDDTASEILEWGDQRLVLNETDEEVLTPGVENQGQMESENGTQVQELGKRNQREAGENPTETQAYRIENQEQLRCQTDAETQSPKWGNQGEGSSEDATEIQAFERRNKKEATGEGKGDIQTQGLGMQGQTTSKNGEELQIPEREQQEQHRGNIQAEERRKKDQFGGEDAVHFQMAGRQNLGQVKEECLKTQALVWSKQIWVGHETVPEIQTPGWENQNQGQKKKARGKNEMKLRLDIPVGWGNQHPGKGKDAGENPMFWRMKLKEIREEDWVVIQAPWWGTQRTVAGEIDREFDTSCWGDQGQMAAEIWAPEMRNQREGGGEGGAEAWSPEVDNQGQLSGKAAVAIQPPVRSLFRAVSEGQLVDKNGSDMQASRKGSMRGVKGEETQRFEEENQGQLSSEMNGKIHTSKWKNEAPVRSKDGANTQAFEAENWRKLTINMNGEVHLSGWEKEEQTERENNVRLQVPENRSQREAGGENGIETQAPKKENQSQLRSDGDGNAHLSKWKNQEQMRGKNRTEIQAPEKRHQREAGGEDGVETQRFEREKQEQLDGEINEESSSPRMKNWEQAGGEDSAENQASEQRNQREVGNEDNTKIQKLVGDNQTTSLNKVNGPEIWAPGEENQIPLISDGDRDAQLSKWKSQEQMGSENAADSPIKGKRNLRGSGVDDGSEIQASGGVNQGELRSEINREIQTEGQGNQNKVGDKDATEIWDVGSQRKSGAEDAGVPRDRKKNQVREKDAAKENLKADCAGGEGRKPSLAQPTALTSSGNETIERGQAVPMSSLASAPDPEMKHLPQQDEVLLLVNGEEEHLAIWGPVPAREHEPQRGGRNDKDVVLGKASSLTQQPWNLPSSVATLSLPSVCPSLQCGPASQGATAFPGTATALTDLPKGPVLKKSQRLVLESLMRRKIAHLKWGLPKRILESYLLLNFLGSCPLPIAGLRLPGLYTDHKFQGQQKRFGEAQGSRAGLKPPKKPPRVNAPGRKCPKLPTQSRALEKCGPYWTEPLGGPIHLEKPRTTRPPGGARDRKATQGETREAEHDHFEQDILVLTAV
ncbi:PREDICTED: uncharacterized protein LOC102822081 [Chrysochloris asiatica]|uniref:Uncharacterized protein LOC102822081 n=1 Tax=Chrysochloris asiatica TaxID=185453 RepID=A0A9B0TU29_CHRAS|nr:PREDICTED: uncharacterized protein LOC102822081 [Chrysochloris asiatica]